MLQTIAKCDIPSCKWQVVLGDEGNADAAEMLEVRDAMGKTKHFCSIEHMRMWASGYVSPYKPKAVAKPKPAVKGPSPFASANHEDY